MPVAGLPPTNVHPTRPEQASHSWTHSTITFPRPSRTHCRSRFSSHRCFIPPQQEPPPPPPATRKRAISLPATFERRHRQRQRQRRSIDVAANTTTNERTNERLNERRQRTRSSTLNPYLGTAHLDISRYYSECIGNEREVLEFRYIHFQGGRTESGK